MGDVSNVALSESLKREVRVSKFASAKLYKAAKAALTCSVSKICYTAGLTPVVWVGETNLFAALNSQPNALPHN